MGKLNVWAKLECCGHHHNGKEMLMAVPVADNPKHIGWLVDNEKDLQASSGLVIIRYCPENQYCHVVTPDILDRLFAHLDDLQAVQAVQPWMIDHL